MAMVESCRALTVFCVPAPVDTLMKTVKELTTHAVHHAAIRPCDPDVGSRLVTAVESPTAGSAARQELVDRLKRPRPTGHRHEPPADCPARGEPELPGAQRMVVGDDPVHPQEEEDGRHDEDQQRDVRG